MKQLFYRLQEQGIDYDFEKDFKGVGEFQGIMMRWMWKEIQAQASALGIAPNWVGFDIDINHKVQNKIRDGTLKPYSNPLYLRWLVQYILGQCVALRGGKEHQNLKQNQVTFHTVATVRKTKRSFMD